MYEVKGANGNCSAGRKWSFAAYFITLQAFEVRHRRRKNLVPSNPLLTLHISILFRSL